MMRWIALFFSTTGFSGFIQLRPGIRGGFMGSLVALAIQLWLVFIDQGGDWNFMIFCFVLVLAMSFIDPAEELMYEKWGEKKRHTGKFTDTDYNETNIDEVAGQLLAGQIVLSIDALVVWEKIALLIVSFGLFRLFDVWKPWPIKQIEQVGVTFLGGAALSILLDDIVAGIYAAVGIIVLLICLIIT